MDLYFVQIHGQTYVSTEVPALQSWTGWHIVCDRDGVVENISSHSGGAFLSVSTNVKECFLDNGMKLSRGINLPAFAATYGKTPYPVKRPLRDIYAHLGQKLDMVA